MPAAESGHALRVMSCLNQQRALGTFCDAALNVGSGMVFLAHRNILACFSDLFQQPAAPAAAPCTEWCLQECPEEGLELLLHFVYTGELKLDNRNLHNVQHAASSLCVEEVLSLCRQYVATSENPAPQKRKRGRPRKPAPDPKPLSSDKEENENAMRVTDADAAVISRTATTTRSGRIVKGPRRLAPEENPAIAFTAPDLSSMRPPPVPGEAVDQSERPTGETEVETHKHHLHVRFSLLDTLLAVVCRCVSSRSKRTTRKLQKKKMAPRGSSPMKSTCPPESRAPRRHGNAKLS